MRSEHVRMAIQGLLRIHVAIQEVHKPQLIKKSFQMTGIYPLNIEQMIAQCKTKLSDEQVAHIHNELPALKTIFRKQGELLDCDFDRFSDWLDEPPKDKLVLFRRRSILLMNKQLLEREEKKLENKNKPKTPSTSSQSSVTKKRKATDEQGNTTRKVTTKKTKKDSRKYNTSS